MKYGYLGNNSSIKNTALVALECSSLEMVTSSSDPSNLCRILVIGDSGVGKSTLLQNLCYSNRSPVIEWTQSCSVELKVVVCCCYCGYCYCCCLLLCWFVFDVAVFCRVSFC